MSNITSKSTCCPPSDIDQNTQVQEKHTTYKEKDNNDLYAISVDGLPLYYVKDEETAHKHMWDIARLYSYKKTISGWQTSFVKISCNELHLVGRCKFFLISYDQVLRRVSYTKIREYV